MGYYYKFPAIKGVQANEEYFACMIPLGVLKNIFIDTDSDVQAEYRAQRKLNEARIPEIKRYILENRDSYVFSALAASVDGTINFSSYSGEDEGVGVVEIEMNAKILINDGQHRKAAILAALEEDESLNEETIPVVLFKDKGLLRSQQMFTDLNKHAVTTSKSLNALYDSRDRASIITKKMIKAIPFLNKYTDKEKDNLGKFSSMFFTLNNFVNANRKLVRLSDNDEEILEFMIGYWNTVISNINEWTDLENRNITKKDLRENYILTQGVTILALGQLAELFYENRQYDMKVYLPRLKNIDWSRSNERDWKGSAIKSNGSINRTAQGINLTCIRIKKNIGLPISESEKALLNKKR